MLLILLELDFNNPNDRIYFLVGIVIAGFCGSFLQKLYDNWRKNIKDK